MLRSLILSLLIVAFHSQLHAEENWGHWRGPTGNGASLKATPPTTWSESENVRWKAEIPGKGSGSPVVWEDRVFVTTAVSADGKEEAVQPPRSRFGGFGRGSAPLSKLKFEILCFDRKEGKLLWRQTAVEATPHQGTHSTNGFASASPCTDGAHVYAHFGSRGLFCYTMEGELVWKREDFGKMNTRNSFGEGSSPTLAGEMILVPWDHDGPSSLYALEKATGKTIWQTSRDEPTCWATPLVVEHEGRQQVVMNGQNKARGYDLETGKELWRCGGQTDRPCATPVAGGGLVFVGSGFRGSYLGAFHLDGRGDIEGTRHVAWEISRDTPDVASPLLSANRLYFYKEKTGILTCVAATTGKPHFPASRIPGVSSTYASPIAAGGYVYLTDRGGKTTVIEDSEELKVVSTNSVGEGVDATPAAVGKELFIRGERHLFCIAESNRD